MIYIPQIVSFDELMDLRAKFIRAAGVEPNTITVAHKYVLDKTFRDAVEICGMKLKCDFRCGSDNIYLTRE